MADTAYQRAKTLLDYVKSNGPKYGPSETDMSSGPGGAAAMNMKMSKAGKVDMGTQMQQMRSISQMKSISDIYNSAARTVSKSKRKNQQNFQNI